MEVKLQAIRTAVLGVVVALVLPLLVPLPHLSATQYDVWPG